MAQDLKPYDSTKGNRGVYVLMFPSNGRPVVALGRDYGLLCTLPPDEARRLLDSAGGPISKWNGYDTGERPRGWDPKEPLDAFWLDANVNCGIRPEEIAA